MEIRVGGTEWGKPFGRVRRRLGLDIGRGKRSFGDIRSVRRIVFVGIVARQG